MTELRLRSAVEFAPSGLLMVDCEGKIVLVNREVERLFGYAREELMGQPVELLVPDMQRDAHANFRAGFYASPSSRVMGAGREIFGRRKDGLKVPVEVSLTPVATDEGLFVLSSIIDISTRKRADLRFRVAVESSPSGMVMSDEAGRIVLVNREVERMFGYAREELLGRPIEMLVPARFRDRHPTFRAGFFKEEPRPRPMGAGRDLYGLRKDGSEIPVEIGLNPIETEEGTFVLSSIVDISPRVRADEERRRLEEQLRQSQKMEALGTLAGGIAHDFNNLLAIILGYAELLRCQVRDESARGDIEEVLRATERGRQVVQQILAFSRQQALQRQRLAMDQAVRDGLTSLRPMIPSNIGIQIQVAEGPLYVMADPTAVYQVLMNLVNNGVQAMPDGGTLRIEVEPNYLRGPADRARPSLPDGSYVLLTVIDTGAGMEAGVRDRAFDPFFTTKGPDRGTGLGLAVVHGIVREHGGLVDLDSMPGQGTRVRCLFPALVGDDARRAAVVERESPRGQGQRVLFVEDEPALANLGGRRLVELGYTAVVVTDPRDALKRMRASSGGIDLVITDYSMPHMNGLELAREISQLQPTSPILLVTGFVEELPPQVLVQAGVSRLLRKPLNQYELAVALREALAPTG